MKTKFNWELFIASYLLMFLMSIDPKQLKTILFVDILPVVFIILIPAFILGQLFRLPKK